MFTLRIKFLQNGQEIFFDLSNPNNVTCSYDERFSELIEDGKKQIIFNLIKDFNNESKQNRNTAELILMLRDLFE